MDDNTDQTAHLINTLEEAVQQSDRQGFIMYIMEKRSEKIIDYISHLPNFDLLPPEMQTVRKRSCWISIHIIDLAFAISKELISEMFELKNGQRVHVNLIALFKSGKIVDEWDSLIAELKTWDFQFYDYQVFRCLAVFDNALLRKTKHSVIDKSLDSIYKFWGLYRKTSEETSALLKIRSRLHQLSMMCIAPLDQMRTSCLMKVYGFEKLEANVIRLMNAESADDPAEAPSLKRCRRMQTDRVQLLKNEINAVIKTKDVMEASISVVSFSLSRFYASASEDADFMAADIEKRVDMVRQAWLVTYLIDVSYGMATKQILPDFNFKSGLPIIWLAFIVTPTGRRLFNDIIKDFNDWRVQPADYECLRTLILLSPTDAGEQIDVARTRVLSTWEKTARSGSKQYMIKTAESLCLLSQEAFATLRDFYQRGMLIEHFQLHDMIESFLVEFERPLPVNYSVGETTEPPSDPPIDALIANARHHLDECSDVANFSKNFAKECVMSLEMFIMEHKMSSAWPRSLCRILTQSCFPLVLLVDISFAIISKRMSDWKKWFKLKNNEKANVELKHVLLIGDNSSMYTEFARLLAQLISCNVTEEDYNHYRLVAIFDGQQTTDPRISKARANVFVNWNCVCDRKSDIISMLGVLERFKRITPAMTSYMRTLFQKCPMTSEDSFVFRNMFISLEHTLSDSENEEH